MNSRTAETAPTSGSHCRIRKEIQNRNRRHFRRAVNSREHPGTTPPPDHPPNPGRPDRVTTRRHRNRSTPQNRRRPDRAPDTCPDWSTKSRNQRPECREVKGPNPSPAAPRSSVTPATSRNHPPGGSQGRQPDRTAGRGERAERSGRTAEGRRQPEARPPPPAPPRCAVPPRIRRARRAALARPARRAARLRHAGSDHRPGTDASPGSGHQTPQGRPVEGLRP